MKFADMSERDETGWSHDELLEFLNDPRWSTICDLLPDGMLMIDRGGVTRYVNAAGESMNELPRASIVGRPLLEFVNESFIQCPGVLEAFNKGERYHENLVDGTGRRLVITGRALRDSKGAMTCYIILQRNLDAFTKGAPLNAGQGGKEASQPQSEPSPLMGVTEDTARLLTVGQRAISMGSRVLLLGESGVGKTEFAKLLHRRSGRESSPFVHVNCAGIPESLFESEMFGYERGSFTGALTRGKPGLIESADGGTLFLDEIGETPLQSQAKLLMVLESGLVQRVGAMQPRRVKVNVVAATNQNLRELVEQGRFRRDLYYRLSVVVLSLPPLRLQRDLIDPLVERFLSSVNQRRETPLQLTKACREKLRQYAFPGNIRELQNLIEYLSVACESTASEEDLPLEASASGPFDGGEPLGIGQHVLTVDIVDESETSELSLKALVRRYESKVIEDAIRRCGSKRKAAELLQTDIATISRKSRPSAAAEA
ncbi:sigma 54-interacting transcriptional regulator [Burkholderia cenocepacia]|uniref:sigma-54 interaction domain-containing protein n=1 Tax=Burkholderia cepacia complex TaxID=87882 RepID=UPI0007556D47|nr:MULTISPECIES: sigma 54-interacting transcriptional regulator [Burkholderia cepacia complex]MCO8324318.1 sigma 54-interacting transcriptional regulator [Burkholderia cenocepacia]MCO8333930.1 sigma 54-interacting transcriptional regulator [Burkholderia cenocepacia]MCO8338888.1 sigma 54-interacting transcriptional regulator [Burkholderia cenocepacia]MCO8346174.1 sigma 54-interacting transcriptional regulator [Burkholderia cenocepacia]MCO8361915.1 sigma 54-interacting transcriptional regulator 